MGGGGPGGGGTGRAAMGAAEQERPVGEGRSGWATEVKGRQGQEPRGRACVDECRAGNHGGGGACMNSSASMHWARLPSPPPKPLSWHQQPAEQPDPRSPSPLPPPPPAHPGGWRGAGRLQRPGRPGQAAGTRGRRPHRPRAAADVLPLRARVAGRGRQQRQAAPVSPAAGRAWAGGGGNPRARGGGGAECGAGGPEGGRADETRLDAAAAAGAAQGQGQRAGFAGRRAAAGPLPAGLPSRAGEEGW